MAKQTLNLKLGRKQLLLVVFVVGAIYVLLPQIGDFKSSWRLLGQARPGFMAVAVVLTFATLAAGAGTYCFLAFKPLNYFRTLLVQLAATFVNRLLPAGVGALGANYLYLRHERHSPAQAGSIVAINNLLGFVGHTLLVSGMLLLFAGSQTSSAGVRSGPDPVLLLKISIAAGVVLVLCGIIFGRQKLSRALADLKKQFLSYGSRPLSLVAALGTSLLLTACNVLCLFFCMHALNTSLPLISVLIVFTLGVSAGAALPTPGGLGGFEAGLAAGFVAYGVDPAPALAIALLYRLVSYWLPFIAGAGAFVACQRRKLFAA